MNELALFAGAGGGILGGKLLGWRTVCAVEIDAYARAVLAARQNDKTLKPFPVWDDVCTFDGRAWRGIVDVVSGGFPCQDISAAGKGAGIGGGRSGLWKEMARIIGEVQPRFVFIENSPMLRSRGLNVVLKDLAKMGYDAKWGVVGAYQVGASHKRDRIWIVANTVCTGVWIQQIAGGKLKNSPVSFDDGQKESLADANSTRRQGFGNSTERGQEKYTMPCLPSGWPAEPNVGRVAHGLANRVDRLKALGNGQVPRVAATAWRILADDWIVRED